MKNGLVWEDTEGNRIEAHGGGILKFNGYYYWYGEDKRLVVGSGRADIYGVSCYRSSDLINWEYRGNVLPGVKKDKNHPLHTSKICERPKVVFNKKTNKFVMIMHLDDATYQYARVGFAISDRPDREFTFSHSESPNGFQSRDIGIFIDPKDESAYLFSTSHENSCLRAIRLSDDYLTYTEDFVFVYPLVQKNGSREAPTIFERNGKYYCITSGCTGWSSNPADVAVASSILGEWTSLGNPCVGRGRNKTFDGQPTFVIKKDDKYILMLDRWNRDDLSSSGYIWLEIEFDKNDCPRISWSDEAVI